MNKDLFLAILALDSYNRGYGERLGGLPASGMLGDARILTDSRIEFDTAGDPRSEDADFYAIA